MKDSSGGTVEMSKHNQTNATIYVYPREKGEQGVQLDRDVDREIAENDRLALYFRPDFVTVGNKELTVQVSVDAFGEYQAYKKNHTIQWDKQQGQQSKYTIEINPGKSLPRCAIWHRKISFCPHLDSSLVFQNRCPQAGWRLLRGQRTG